jgi:CheY-like chemotaxis protein
MSDKKIKILAVDDEDFNLDIITEYLTAEGFDVVQAQDGLIAMQKLSENPDVQAVVLDRMMPNMDGMEVLKKIKSDAKYKDLPIVMQTAAALSYQVKEGIDAGAYYYLTKPYEESILIGIVRGAVGDYERKKEIIEELHKVYSVSGLMEKSLFHFSTLEEAKNLAYYIANSFSDPYKIAYGLSEIMINAIEHGNLGITYEQKTDLILSGKYNDEIQKRLNLPENREKKAYLSYSTDGKKIIFNIKDQGNGFNWEKHLFISSEGAANPNCRGIATAKMLSFSGIEYKGNGNEVDCWIDIS